MKPKDVERLAKDRGAKVNHKGDYIKISRDEKRGSAFVQNSNESIPAATMKILWKWLKIIGVLVVVFMILRTVW